VSVFTCLLTYLQPKPQNIITNTEELKPKRSRFRVNETEVKLPESSKVLPQFHLASPAPIQIEKLEDHAFKIQGDKSAVPKLASNELKTPAKTQVNSNVRRITRGFTN
jgi:hypothetical protein